MARGVTTGKLKYKTLSNKNIAFNDISFDQNIIKWKQYLSTHKPIGTQLFSENQKLTSRQLDFAGLPMYILVDEEGNFKKYPSFKVAKAKLEQNN